MLATVYRAPWRNLFIPCHITSHSGIREEIPVLTGPPCELLSHWFWNSRFILSATLNPTLAIHSLRGGKNTAVCPRVLSLPWSLLHFHKYCIWAKKAHAFLNGFHLHISGPLCDLCCTKHSLLLSHLPDYSINLQGLTWKSPHCIDSLNSMGQGFSGLSLHPSGFSQDNVSFYLSVTWGFYMAIPGMVSRLQNDIPGKVPCIQHLCLPTRQELQIVPRGRSALSHVLLLW